jgi:3-oxoacyl-[acyl-carrier-protein] synthase-3
MKNPPQFNLKEITGIVSRRIRSDHENSLTMALNAAQTCLKNSRLKAADLDIVISCSITRFVDHNTHRFEPAMSLHIKREINAKKAIYFDVANACAGMFTGLFILDTMIKSGAVRNGMVVSGECISPITETAIAEIKNDYDPQFASLTVGDAGAAVILEKADNNSNTIDFFEMLSCAEYSHLCIGQPSDQSNKFALYTNNTQMHKSARLKIQSDFQIDALAKLDRKFKTENYDYVIQHQVGTKFISKVCDIAAQNVECPMPETIFTVDYTGNTASTAHFVVLYEFLKNKKIKKDAKVLFVPAASGFVTGCLSVTVNDLQV